MPSAIKSAASFFMAYLRFPDVSRRWDFPAKRQKKSIRFNARRRSFKITARRLALQPVCRGCLFADAGVLPPRLRDIGAAAGVAFLELGDPAVEARARIVRLERDRPVEIVDRALELAAVGVGEAAIVVGGCEIRREADRRVVILQRRFAFGGLRRGRRARVDAHGLLDGLLGAAALPAAPVRGPAAVIRVRTGGL